MTIQMDNSLREQLGAALKDMSFRKAFKRMAKDERKRSSSRKTLFFFTLAYGSILTYLLTQIL